MKKINLITCFFWAFYISSFAEEVSEPIYKFSASSELKSSSSKHYYGPENLLGNDPERAWCEGSPGSGVGEWIRVEFEGNTNRAMVESLNIKILPGYGKNSDLYTENARPSKIKAIIYYGKQKEVLIVKRFMIEDSLKMQKFRIVLDRELDLSDLSITLEIDEVYNGSKYEDLCISELNIQASIFNEKKKNDIFNIESSALREVEIIKSKIASAMDGDSSAIQKLIRMSLGAYFNTAEGGEWLSEIYLDLFIAHPFKFVFLLSKQDQDIISKIAPLLNYPQIEKYSNKDISQAFIEAERQGANVKIIKNYR